MTTIEKDFLDSCKFTIKELLNICEKNDDMTVREKKYLDKRLNDLSDYKGDSGNELEFKPTKEQLTFINEFLPFLIKNNNTKINEIMQVYSLNIDMTFWDRAGQDVLSVRLNQTKIKKIQQLKPCGQIFDSDDFPWMKPR
jgi:hypothetical protein